MSAIATLPVVLQTGTLGSRPAANAVAAGTLYSATDTGLIYQSNGSAWSTWAIASASGTGSAATSGALVYAASTFR